jgi:hypothetical protein
LLSERLGQTFVVENRSGASSNIPTDAPRGGQHQLNRRNLKNRKKMLIATLGRGIIPIALSRSS